MAIRPRSVALAAAATFVLSACTAGFAAPAPPGIGQTKTLPTTTAAGAPRTTVTPSTTLAPGSTAPAPPATAAPSTTPPIAGPAIGDVINIGDAKPQRFYDAYLAAALHDIETWWAAEFPRLYGEPYNVLEGGIYAAYPERIDPIPGCGFPGNTSYQEVSDYGAFFCPDGDFIAYDDGERGIIHDLADEFNPSVIAVVMAHEFGHAIQFRAGDLDRRVATVVTEQQADCMSGAWAGRAWRGQVPGLRFTDEDIHTGLIALVAVADPIGTSVFEPGGHGAAFDRIGAFQAGFNDGVDACVPLIDEPLPLLPNEFLDGPGSEDELFAGNAPYGWQQGQIMYILDQDLRSWWPKTLAANSLAAPSIELRPVTDPNTDNCGDPERLQETGAVYCAATSQVLFWDIRGRELYDNFGDFAVGYTIGLAWAEGVQQAVGSELEGEARALGSECLVGAWIGTAIEQLGVQPGQPTTTAPDAQQGRVMRISPGDLDEAIEVALTIGDPRLDDDVEGSAYEKIAMMRVGVLQGLPSCIAWIRS